MLCFTLYSRANSKYKLPGGLNSEGRFKGGFFALRFWGAYIWRGLFSEFYGIQDNHGRTPFHQCIIRGIEKLVRFFLDHKADVNIQDEDGRTPLHWCARERNENLCRLLLEHNADVNIQDNHGRTLFHQCIIRGKENLVRLLLIHNADVSIQDTYGYTPLHLLVRDLHIFNGKKIDLVVKYGAENRDIREAEGRTPLQMAVRCGNAQAVKKLVDHGADVSLVEADETDVRRLKRLKNEAKKMEPHLKVEMGSAQKFNETKRTAGVASVQDAEKLTVSSQIRENTEANPLVYVYNKGNRGRSGS